MADLTTERLNFDAAGIARAANLLTAGGLVAFRTETVYGLGADAGNGSAVAGIYAAKGRPAFNPLIVHVQSYGEACKLGHFPDAARAMVAEEWPAALTLVVALKADAGIAPIVTSGHASIALRVPADPLAQELMRAVGRPIAAPSANPSGRISPTTAEHVLSGLSGRIDAVLDGGPCPMGLESTIVSFLDGPPTLLRPGTADVAFDGVKVAQEVPESPLSPGQLAFHYAPLAHVRLNATTKLPGETHLGFGDVPGDVSLSDSGDLREASAALFATLHQMDQSGVTHIAVAPIPETGLGLAINDRLRRAAAPRP